MRNTPNRLAAGGWLLMALVLLSPPAGAQVPYLIRYQGQAVDSQGVPLEGPYNLTFRLYDAETGGNKVWEEAQANVPLTGGHFSVLLGQIATLGGAAGPSVDWSKPRWLSLQVGADPELSPRQRITSVPLAIMAEQLTGPITTVDDKVGIGTTAPTRLLDIVGANPVLQVRNTGGVEGFIQAEPTTNRVYFGSHSTHPVAIGVGTNEHIFINTIGNVGIGTTTPESRLHVAAPGAAVLTIEGSSGAQVKLLRAAADWRITNSDIGGLAFDQPAIGTVLLIKDNGNVGIGVTNPQKKLFIGSNLGSSADGIGIDGVLTLYRSGEPPTPPPNIVYLYAGLDSCLHVKSAQGDKALCPP